MSDESIGSSNIILIVLDTARAKNFSTFGYARETSSKLDRLASESTVYENTISPSPWTLPSHASIFSGLYPSHHGVTRSSLEFPNDIDNLPNLLGNAGYSTSCFTANKILFQDRILKKGFDEALLTTRKFPTNTDNQPYSDLYNAYNGVSPTSIRGLADFIASDEASKKDILNIFCEFWEEEVDIFDSSQLHSAENNLKEFKKALNGTGNFIYMNFMDTHLPYTAPDSNLVKYTPKDLDIGEVRDVNQDSRLYNYANAIDMTSDDFDKLEALYNASIDYVDSFVGEIHDYLKKTNKFEDTMLIILGDHGENIGEDSKMGHSLSLSDSVLKVPLVISYPQGSGGKRIKSLVQSHDLFPTILTAAGIDPATVEAPLGEDAKLLPKTDEDERDYAVAEYLGSPFEGIRSVMEDYPDVDYGQYDYELKCIYDNNSNKIIFDSRGEERMYKNADVEMSYENNEAKAKDLKEELFNRVEEFGETQRKNNGEELTQTLRDLGYI